MDMVVANLNFAQPSSENRVLRVRHPKGAVQDVVVRNQVPVRLMNMHSQVEFASVFNQVLFLLAVGLDNAMA